MDVRAEIVRMNREGKSYGQIAKALKLSRGTVGGHIARHRLNIPTTRWKDDYTPEEDAIIRRMREEGYNCGEIARHLGRPYDGVRKRGSNMGLVWSYKQGVFGDQHVSLRTENEAFLRAQDEAFVIHLRKAYERGEFPQ